MTNKALGSTRWASRTTHRASHWALVLLLLGFLLLATLYNAVVPLGEGPDEPGHLAYVFFLAREGRLPVQTTDPATSDVPGEGHQPPLAYLLMLPTVAWLPAVDQQVQLSANPRFVWNGGTEAAAFMRGSREYWPWQGTTLAWHLARSVSLLLGMLTLLCVYLAARQLAAQQPTATPHASPLALLAVALVAFNPQFLFTSALVTNDALLATLSAVLFWLCLRWQATAGAALPKGTQVPVALRRNTHALLVGALFGAALLTKQSALLLGPLLLWASWRASGGRWWLFARTVLIWATVTLLLAGWWYLRNWQLYGDPFGLEAFRAKFTTQAFAWDSLAAWQGALTQLYASFWARFGWLSLHPPAWVIWLYAALGLAAALGYALAVITAWRGLTARLRQAAASPLRLVRSPWMGVALLLLMALAWTVSFALTAGLVAWQGRMLFPALAAIAIVLAAGLWRLSHRLVFVVPVVLCLVALYLPLGVIAPAYEWRTLPAAQAQASLGQAVYARYAQSWERGVELRGWRSEGLAEPGTTINVTLTWHVLERVPHDWTVFVHLVDGADRIVAEHNSQPQNGAFPMSGWTVGDWLLDTHSLSLSPDLAAGSYTLRIGLYLPAQGGRRQGVWAADGRPLGDYADIGTIIVPAERD